MSRIYHAQPPKQSSSHVPPTGAAASASSSATSLTTPAASSGGSRVSANVKLFTNNLNANNSNQPSPSPSSSSSNASSPSLPPKTTAAPNNNKSTSSGGANTANKTTNPTSITNLNNKTHTSPTTNTTTTTTTTPPTAVTNTVLPTPVAELDQMAQENISQLITRLEKVANRLESVAVSAAGQSSTTTMNGVAPKAVAAAVAHDDTESSASIVAYDDLLNNSLTPFVQLSAKIGADVKSIADLVEKAFKYQRGFLVDAARSAQPSQDVLAKFYPLFSKNIEEVSNFREKNRKSEFFNHLSAISESIGALGWIAVSPAPSPYVKEMSDAAQFYTNRVLKDYKEKDPNHALWVKQWLQLLTELQAYVKQCHTTGVAWNSTKRSDTFDPSRVGSGSSASVAAPAAGGAGGPPPPPPPSIPDFPFHLFTDDGKSASNTPSSQALFAEINKGGAITSHLKKVNDDQKTHKNPALRGGNTVPAGSLSATSSATSLQSKPSTASVKPPVFELEDKKWRVEYMQGRNDLVIDQTDLKHTVYIYQCNGSTITVKGKVNSIIVDSCNRVGLLFDDVLSTVEFINSKSVQMQVLGKVPTVSIEKTDSCQVYLSRDSLHTEIVSSKSSAMNVLVPNEHDDDYTEQPVPEQFKTMVNLKTRKLETTQTDI